MLLFLLHGEIRTLTKTAVMTAPMPACYPPCYVTMPRPIFTVYSQSHNYKEKLTDFPSTFKDPFLEFLRNCLDVFHACEEQSVMNLEIITDCNCRYKTQATRRQTRQKRFHKYMLHSTLLYCANTLTKPNLRTSRTSKTKFKEARVPHCLFDVGRCGCSPGTVNCNITTLLDHMVLKS